MRIGRKDEKLTKGGIELVLCMKSDVDFEVEIKIKIFSFQIAQ